MIPFELHEIVSVLRAKQIGPNCIIHTISTNSNSINQNCMFIALVGKNFDGHNFVHHAILAGARAVLVNSYNEFYNIPQLIVSDTYNALMSLAGWIRRRQVSVKVAAITGSSGKTSVKEMTASILNRCGKVIATKDNFNNTIGVSNTLLRLTEDSDFLVVELGASYSGEVAKLSKIIFSDVALINNIFPSHLLGFKSLNGIKKEKGKIFSGLNVNGKGIINIDNNALSIWNRELNGRDIWNFALNYKSNADFFASNIVFNNNGTRFKLHSPLGVVSVFLPVLGIHNITNALAASALACAMGATLSDIVFGLQNVIKLPGRLFPIILKKGKLLLDDTYNSNVGSMISAINVLNRMPGYRILVTSDMLELGKYKSIKYHNYIGKLILNTNIHQVLTIGDDSYFISKMSKRGKHFTNKMSLIFYLRKKLFKYKLISILVKGSRNFQMEQIINCIKEESACRYG